MSSIIRIIGKNAKRLREANAFSQSNIADFLGVDQSLISKFEKGERTINVDLLEKLAVLYGCRLSDLNEESLAEQRIKIAFRANTLSADDLHVIHDIKRVAMNCIFMTELLGGAGIER